MSLREVREAAELHREGIKADINVVVDYALATIDPSPDSAITADWLREVWGFENDTSNKDGMREKLDDLKMWRHHDGAWACYGDILEWPHDLHTRQQFCDLAKCLGIPRKKPKPEPEGCTCLSSPNMLYAPCSYCDKQRKDGAK